MIEDLEGATVEPARRGHVLALSAATAAISLVLLVALVVPPASVSVTPQLASPYPGASTNLVVPHIWGPTIFLGSNPPFTQSRTSPLDVNVRMVVECADGTRIDRPYYLVFEGNGQVMAVPLDARTERSVPIAASVERAPSPLIVSCATSGDRVPQTNRRR